MEPIVGGIYEGKVKKVLEFGAIVEFLEKYSGLIHISELANYRVKQVSDLVKEGQTVFVKVKAFGEQGKISLSIKNVDQETGQNIE